MKFSPGACAAIFVLVLSGCASNDELIESQGQKINNLTNQVNVLSNQVGRMDSKHNKLDALVMKNNNEFSKIIEAEKNQSRKYTIIEGDSLSSIANKAGLSVKELLKNNPQITNPDQLLIGHELNI
ncbi:LysM peptidoglycan-binding domain-containing protein [Vibrio diabolicus]